MLSRRRFLGYSLASAAAATVVGCRPPDFDQFSSSEPYSNIGSSFLASQKELKNRRKYFLGYPLNMNTPPESFFSWRSKLGKIGYGDFGFNNVGNPFAHGSIPFNSHDLERETILRFGEQYGFSSDNTWGFLSHSGTDSNMHGMYIGRTILKGITGVVPKCYFTKEAHYSIQILSDLLGMEMEFVNTLDDASMDIDDLESRLYANPDQPALIVAAIGSTFKGAIDDVDRIRELMRTTDSYLHLDAALFGGYLPHTAGAKKISHKLEGQNRMSRYDSIAVSCHKFFGFPSPAGLFLTSKTVYDEFHKLYSTVHNPEYIGHVPGTITCSRDAVKPAEFFYFSTPQSIKKQAEDAKAILRLTDYLYGQMQSHFPGLNASCTNNLSNTIYFRKPGKDIVEKYSLATMHLDVDGELQHYAHAVVMPHIKKKVLDEFLSDLNEDSSIRLG